MKSFTVINLFACAVLVAAIAACNKAPESQPQAQAQKPATVVDPAVAQAEQLKKQAEQNSQTAAETAQTTVASAESTATPADAASADASSLLDQARKLVDEKKYSEANTLLQQLSKLQLTAEQQDALEKLRELILKAGTQDVSNAVGNVIGNTQP
jgi:hypothetical protein